jgi:predicted pyridoxine 5'-phosphate oxidase superfamily flavin-nucleotide-binding protein
MSVKLTDEIREHVNGALAAGDPMVLASVDGAGQPRLTFRGSIQAFGDDQLSFWARNAEGATMDAIRGNPRVALLYRAGAKRVMLQFQGGARIASDTAERDAAYDRAPEREQTADPERKGVAVIIDLGRVEGMLGLGEDGKPRFVRMTREG